MKAVLRLVGHIGVAALIATAMPALAQSTDTPPDNGAVGPRELQNFSINGTVTQPAPSQPAARPTPTPAQPRTTAPATTPVRPTATAPAATTPAPTTTQRSTPARPPTDQTVSAPIRQPAIETAPTSPSTTVPLPPIDSTNGAPATTPLATGPQPPPADNIQSSSRPSLLPWLLAGFALLLAGGFLFYRRSQSRLSYASDAGAMHFASPEPAPTPRPAPVPAPRAPAPAASPPIPAPQPAFPGIVSTRLRPTMEIGIRPLRCVLDEQNAAIEFEIELVNSGNAPARDVLVEAQIVNAGPQQDQAIDSFFANPNGQGQRIPVIAPLGRMTFGTRVATDRQHLQIYEVGDRKVFVPLLAFNILYQGARAGGQTSVAYLVGRDNKSDKLAPFRADLGPRIFRELGAKLLPNHVRN